MSDGENGTSNGAEFDFTPIGQAIKKARETNGITREQLAEQLDYAARHIQSIENEGQHPSFQLFTQLVTMFDISVDQYIFPEKKSNKSTRRRQIDSLLDTLDDRELSVIEATANSLCKAKEQTEE
ncbi:MAG TPA: transcriptional regulator [Ruminococcaceae bacterium]|jgi:ribosome-binding protein aMBF1 (putative translation factor)|nr:transcriptional regulator [Oscillospiraceae bacterium]